MPYALRVTVNGFCQSERGSIAGGQSQIAIPKRLSTTELNLWGRQRLCDAPRAEGCYLYASVEV